MPDRNLIGLLRVTHKGVPEIVVMSTDQDRNIAKADECEKKAKEALDLSVRRHFFAKLARDYRRLAEPTERPAA
jgi:hypothetical protein